MDAEFIDMLEFIIGFITATIVYFIIYCIITYKIVRTIGED